MLPVMITTISNLKSSRYCCCEIIQSVGRTSHRSFIVIGNGVFQLSFLGDQKFERYCGKSLCYIEKADCFTLYLV